MNKMYLVLGDWSNDGHGHSDKVLLESNLTVKEVQDAYKASCKLTGVEFNHNETFTGRKRDWQEADDYRIATEYESSNIPSEALVELRKFGLTDELLQSFEEDEINLNEDGSYGLSEHSFVNLWMWFVKLSNPNLVIQRASAKDETPCINGYWDENLNVGFGYGLY